MATFGDLYEYNTTSGIIIPETEDIKQNVELAFKQIFGDDFSTDPTTANGRLIEALTLLFIDVCGINAQNITALNITQAINAFLDQLGGNWGVVRIDGETDSAYRKRIIESCSRGSGFVQSIRNALGLVSGVTSVTVLENGNTNPAMRPLDANGDRLDHSISVAPNSVAIFIQGGDNNSIAKAINSTISCGCAYTRYPDYSAPTEVITSYDDGSNATVYFYRPTNRYVGISISVSSAQYTGDDITTDAKTAITNLLNSNKTNSTITKSQVIAAIAAYGTGMIATNVSLLIDDANQDLSTSAEVESIIIPAYKIIVFSTDNIDVQEV